MDYAAGTPIGVQLFFDQSGFVWLSNLLWIQTEGHSRHLRTIWSAKASDQAIVVNIHPKNDPAVDVTCIFF